MVVEQDAIAPTDFDSPWKEALEVYFDSFMLFFFPHIHAEIDWKKGHAFLDKEFQEIVRDAATGRRYVDKLVKVFLPDGKETWLLIHIEVQSSAEKLFPKRMLTYNNRISDAYDVEVVSLAILSDDNPAYRPDHYRHERWGCEHIFRFPTAKLLDYKENWPALEKSPNPFSMVVMAHLKSLEVKDGHERKRWKLRLVRLLYERGYEKKDVLDLFRFIDWLLALPKALEKELREELQALDEERKMPYVTNIERFAKEEGALQNAREMVLEALNIRFKSVPEDIASALQAMDSGDMLKSLLRQAITCRSLASFRKALQSAVAGAST